MNETNTDFRNVTPVLSGLQCPSEPVEKERCWTQVGLLYLEKREALFKSLHEAWEHPLGNPRLDIKGTVAFKIKKKKTLRLERQLS